MKTWTKIWLSVLMYLFLAGVASASNPTGYITLHPAYGRAEGQGVENGKYMVCGVNIRYYIQYFRVFVPPGALRIMLEINDWNGQSVIAHHETPPTSEFGQLPIATSGTLEYLEGADRYFPGYAGTGKVSILYDGFASPYLSAARGGWLYVKVDADRYAGPEKYTNAVSFTVNADAYNDWYDHAGSNPDGSINWEKDIESVTEYLPPNAKPGKPVVTPASDTIWTTGTTQTITATSTKADSIYGAFTKSEVNDPPIDPRIPSAEDSDVKGEGASLSTDLQGVAGEIRRYKYRFVSVNASGLSDESGIYSYTIDLRPVTPGDVTVAPETGTPLKSSPFDITVVSDNATKIYYTKTTDGTVPPDPTDAAENVSGPKNVISLERIPGQQITTFKMKFMGYNEYGRGTSGKISDEYTYVMDLTPPGAVIADPSSGNWTSAQPPVKLTCKGADKIYYTFKSSTSGAPADPAEPTETAYDVVITLTDGSGTYNIPSGSNVDTQTKVRFKGWNGGGFSTSSLLCTYEINTYTPPPAGDPPGTASANPASGSWTDASQAFTSVSAQGATSILATYTKTTDGSTPGTPADPNSSNAMLSNSGSTVKFPIPTTSQKLTKVLMKFVGTNQYGLGTVSAICSYSIDLTGQIAKTPGDVTVNPTSGSWAIAGQKIAVSSANATQIEYAYNKTTDGTDPAVPSDPSVPIAPSNPFFPSPTSNEIRGTISGASGTFTVPSSAGATTKIKIKFCGKNAAGYGTNTQAYSYTIDLRTSVQSPAAVVVSPTDTSWTTGPQKVSVSSTNAKQINYTYTKTEDDSEPSAPTDPSAATEVAGQTSGAVTGASGTFDVPYSTNKNTRIKIRFCGKNDAGYGVATSAYSYSINLKLPAPATVVVSPADTSWTTAPQTISVSSTNATQINYVYTKTEDGSEPTAPTDPSTATNVAGQTLGSITGASGKFDVPSSPNKNTRIKIRFCGKNDAGYGTATSTYSYGINLMYKYGDTISQSYAKANPGLNITSIILTTVGAESILDPTAKFLKIDSTLSYSVVELVTDFLKTLLKDSSIQVATSTDGVMTISSPNFGGIVFTVVTGALFTTADSDYSTSTDTGNIVICTQNMLIVLYPAGANQTVFKKTIESFVGWTVTYGADHLVLVNIPDVPEYNMMAFRFQFHADKGTLSDTGSALCGFSGSVFEAVVVTYPDGTKQNLVPFIHEPEIFSAVLKKDYNQTCSIDSGTGLISIKDAQNSVIWKGAPEYKLYGQWGNENPEIKPKSDSSGKDFITSQGLQFLKSK